MVGHPLSLAGQPPHQSPSPASPPSIPRLRTQDPSEKRLAKPTEELTADLFRLFERQAHWSFSQLQRQTDQPTQHLKARSGMATGAGLPCSARGHARLRNAHAGHVLVSLWAKQTPDLQRSGRMPDQRS